MFFCFFTFIINVFFSAAVATFSQVLLSDVSLSIHVKADENDDACFVPLLFRYKS